MEELNLPDVVTVAIPFFVVLVLAEIVAWRRGTKAAHQGRGLRFEPRDAAASLSMGLGNVAVKLFTGGVIFAAYVALYENRLFDLPVTWWIFVLAFIGDDFAYYWFHRLAHERRWFWASHIIHHSSQHYNLTTALRQTWTSTLSLSFVFTLPLAWLGFHPAILAFVSGLNLIYQFWIHTEAIDRLPRWFEAVFNTPSHHRVHHATNPRYLDSNYAGTLIIWDRMFGSFVPEVDHEPPKYGIVKNLGTFNPLKIAFHEWWGIAKDLASARSLREVAGYTFGPPGWSPDGSRKTSAMLKEEWARVHGADETAGPAKPVAHPAE